MELAKRRLVASPKDRFGSTCPLQAPPLYVFGKGSTQGPVMRIATGLLMAFLLVGGLILYSACTTRGPPPVDEAWNKEAVDRAMAPYAKGADADCVVHPQEYYDKRGATLQGLQELVLLTCQYQARGEYRRSQLGTKEESNNHLQTALRCTREAETARDAMRMAGITNVNCQ